MHHDYVVLFENIQPEDLVKIGGKAYNLGLLKQKGFPVPPGLCISVDAYRDFLIFNNLEKAVSLTAYLTEPEDITKAAANLRQMVLAGEIPEAVSEALIKAWKTIGAEFYYAVRSSALAEDGTFASFAGQQDTYLNIHGAESLLRHLKQCWASLFSDRAMLYRRQNNIQEKQPAIAVVLQKMVDATAAGMMFTAHPATGQRGKLYIEAGYGLGEALVSGLVDADLYMVEKEREEILDKSIKKKNIKITAQAQGGVKTEQVDSEQAEEQVLTDELILQLAKWGKKAESIYNTPQDMEWACQNDTLFILQSRPITSLFPLATPLPQDKDLHVYLSLSHLQVMTEPISPMGIDLLRHLSTIDEAKSAGDYVFMKAAGGRVYVDISHILALKTVGRIVSKVSSNIDYLFHVALETLRSRSDFQKRIHRNAKASHTLRSFALGIVRNAAQNVLYRNPKGQIKAYSEYINMRIIEAQEKLGKAVSEKQKLQTLHEILNFRREFRYAMPKLAAGMLSYKALEELEKRWLGTNQYVNKIVSGLEGSYTAELGLHTADLAAFVSKSPELQTLLSDTPSALLSQKIEDLSGNEAFKACFDDFMKKFGMRSSGEIDVARERWCENPKPIVQSILAMAANSGKETLREEYQKKTQVSIAQETELIQEIREKKGRLKGTVASRLLKVMRNYMPLRETPKHFIMHLFMMARNVLLAEGAKLVQQGRLEQKEDIFYLDYWHLFETMETDCDYCSIVTKRKEEYTHYTKLTPPRVMTSDGEDIKGAYKRDFLPDNAYAGMPTSAGRIQGIAKVVRDPSKERVAQGEILVVPFTDPGWTPLFLNASALVAEVGGMLTHGSIVAREYGIPAVVGVENATTLIKSGQKILVDGDQGWVQILVSDDMES